jgi:hypothetical protein
VDFDVPDRYRDAACSVEQAMEEHEIELMAALSERTTDRLPQDGTEDERRAKLRELILGDPEAIDLYMRLKLIECFGGGRYRQTILELQEASLEHGA